MLAQAGGFPALFDIFNNGGGVAAMALILEAKEKEGEILMEKFLDALELAILLE